MSFGKPPKRVDGQALQHYAAMLVAQRAMSSGEMRQKLRLKALNPEDIEVVLAKLTEYGALNDTRYAEAYASARKENQGFGQQRVLRDLNKKRISSEMAKEAVATTFSGTDEIALVEATPEEYREHGRFKIAAHGRPSWAHPIVAGGRLYLRDQDSLTAYDLRGK